MFCYQLNLDFAIISGADNGVSICTKDNTLDTLGCHRQDWLGSDHLY
jgi:hypothetical protein